MKPLIVPIGGENAEEINEALEAGRAIVWYNAQVLDENLNPIPATMPWNEKSLEDLGWKRLGYTTDDGWDIDE